MDIADEPKVHKTKEKQSFRDVNLIIFYVLELLNQKFGPDGPIRSF